MKKVYHEGKLVPVKDWDFDKKRPKQKIGKKETVQVLVDQTPEVIFEEQGDINA